MNSNALRYVRGISWFILSLIVSVANDSFAKHLSGNLDSNQVAFFRFFFGVLTLLPFMIYRGKEAFKTNRFFMHISRGAILYVAISLWIYSLSIVPIVVATLTTFVVPLFVLILAPIFLKEKISTPLLFATIVGFLGVLIVLEPNSSAFNPSSLLMLVSAFMFASLDIINKKFVQKESMLSMLFYSALVTALLGFFPALESWKQPSTQDLITCLFLGAGGNLILFFLLKAFSLVPASSVAPYRYLELIFSGVVGYLFFAEVPTIYSAVGAAIIVPATLYVAYKQINK